MNTLFALEPVPPEGFRYFPDFIDAEEERFLVEAIKQMQLHTFQFQGYAAKRKVASFGQDWSFEHRRLSRGKDIPAAFHPLMLKVAQHLYISSEAFAELLVTEYPQHSVINWHRDAPPFDLIAGISLLADCTFRLRPHEKAQQGRGSIVSLPVARRSLYTMQGPARSDWQHSIAPVSTLRYSITLRTLRNT